MTLDETIAVLRSPEGKEETRRVFYLRKAVDFAEINMRAGSLTRADAESLVDAVAAYAEQLFPGSSETFGIVYGVRLRRIIGEVFGPAD